MCQSTIPRIFLLAATQHTCRQSEYREQETPVSPFNSCVTLRMKIIPPPTQVSVTYPPALPLATHWFTVGTVLSPSQPSLNNLPKAPHLEDGRARRRPSDSRPHSNHTLLCPLPGDAGIRASSSPVKWHWPSLTFIKSFRRP